MFVQRTPSGHSTCPLIDTVPCRPTTRAASRRRGRSAAPLQRLPTIDADLTSDEDDEAFFDDPGSLRRGRKKACCFSAVSIL